MANVTFKQGTRAQYDAIALKDDKALYWLNDTEELFKGDVLYGKGAEATALASGLMSAADKSKLDNLSSGGAIGLTAVDASVVVSTDAGGTTIGVQVSGEPGNAIELKADGLYATAPAVVEAVEFSIEKQATAAAGQCATYKLKRADGSNVTYVGDEINIPKDLVLQRGTMEVATEADKPYAGAAVGDPYIDLTLNDAAATHIYIPVKGLVDTFTAGDGIKNDGNVISVKVDSTNANGLAAVAGGLRLAEATASAAGAMSAVDKAALDAAVSDIAEIKSSIAWSDMGDGDVV